MHSILEVHQERRAIEGASTNPASVVGGSPNGRCAGLKALNKEPFMTRVCYSRQQARAEKRAIFKQLRSLKKAETQRTPKT